MPLKVNGQSKALWQSHRIKKDDVIELGFAKSGLRCYLAVAGGFQLPKHFGSNSTVLREKVGGIAGAALQQGQFYLCARHTGLYSGLYRKNFGRTSQLRSNWV